jgi:hypothetical protein
MNLGVGAALSAAPTPKFIPQICNAVFSVDSTIELIPEMLVGEVRSLNGHH